MSIIGLGPHGERAQPAESLKISDEDAAVARARQFKVAVVLHSTNNDWAKQQLAGIVKTLGDYSAILSEVVDCGFSSETQIAALARLQRVKPDAIISFPVGSAVVARAHRDITKAGIKLTLIDNVPTGLLPGVDYAGVVSADNFHLGQIAAKLLSPHVPRDGVVGVLAYGIDFFVTNEREIAFHKWMETQRSDLLLKIARFTDAGDVVAALNQLLDTDPHPAGLFVSWDKPAMQAVEELRRRERHMPVTTIDLGHEAGLELAGGGFIKGIGAQQPCGQGVAVAKMAILALLGRQPPPWVALPVLAVTPENVIEAYETVWQAPAAPDLHEARRAAVKET